ncbi:MAG TPA: dihydrodipicolinate synthase family protein [Bryobacteraceae bacterium]|nr:dihydrodipicolinate synthase family protein [Bryobacteraceae bacterium]
MPTSFDRRHFLQMTAALSAAPALSAAQAPNTNTKAWQGIFVIMQTPFLENLAIDEECLRKETDFLCRGGVHGVVWPAGASETSSLSFNERMRYSPTVVKEAKGRATVLIGVHGANKFEAMEYARFAEKIGADGLHALGPTDGYGDSKYMEDYFTSIASVSKLPMCIQVSNPGMTTDFLLHIADKIPSVRILKLEAGNVPHEVTRVLKERKRTDLFPSTGGGAMNLYDEMERGSGGTMAGAGFADIQAQIWDWYHAGKKNESYELFQKFLLSAVLERRTTFVLMKEILRRRGIFKNVVMRRTSRFTMDAGDLRDLDRIMEMLKPHFRA